MRGEPFEAYEARVKRYGWSWFRSDAAATAVLRQVAEVRARVYGLAAGFQTIGTEMLYRAGDRWVGNRAELHERLVGEALRAGGFDASADGSDAVPQAVLLLGLPGSGKSTALRPVGEELVRRTADASHVVVDTDIVRGLFPEYAAGLGSVVVHPESSYVTNRLLLDEAYRLGVNVILDKVGDPRSTVAEVEYLLRVGWSVWCLCSQVDVEVAVERAKRRAVDGGRYVPIDLIRESAAQPMLAYQAIRGSGLPVSGSALLDTGGPQGGRPVVVEAHTEDLFGPPGSEVAVWPRPADGEVLEPW